MNKKIILVDAVGCLVDNQGNVNFKIENLLKEYVNRKIVVTNADDAEKEIFLKNISHEYFTLKHNPNKENPEYFNKFLTSYDFKPDQLIYFEHDMDAVKSAQSQGITAHHFDGNLEKLKSFLNFNLKEESNL